MYCRLVKLPKIGFKIALFTMYVGKADHIAEIPCNIAMIQVYCRVLNIYADRQVHKRRQVHK